MEPNKCSRYLKKLGTQLVLNLYFGTQFGCSLYFKGLINAQNYFETVICIFVKLFKLKIYISSVVFKLNYENFDFSIKFVT